MARPFSLRRATAAAPDAVAEPAREPRAWWQEALALLLVAAALFLALALLSHRGDPQDATRRGAEWMGPVGSACAGFLARGFGLVAWLLPVELLLAARPLLARRWPGGASARVAGDLIVGVVLASLVQVAAPGAKAFGALPAAGNVGLVFGELMRGLFSSAGSFLIGVTIVGLVLTRRASFSFIDACRRLIDAGERFRGGAREGARRLGTAWNQARELQREQRREAEARAVPRIATPSDEAILAELAAEPEEEALLGETGTPPLAVSTALRSIRFDVEPDSEARSEGEDGLVAALRATPTPAAPLPSPPPSAPGGSAAFEPSPPPTSGEAPAPAGHHQRSADNPVIVDTRPDQEVRRARRPRPREQKFELPGADLFAPTPPAVAPPDRGELLERARLLEKTLADYGVSAKVEEIQPGPTVTTYEASLQAGTKVAKVANLADDLALGLSCTVRIIAPIPGKSRVGFELANAERVPVNLRELLEDERFAKLAERAPLPVVLGRDIVGKPFYADLAGMPHVIVAGATGQGKSVGLNVMLSSLLFCRTPQELRLLLIDPKVVELAPFEGIPHLLLPVVTDMKQAATALKWAVDEMERRYQLFANAGTKNILTYNAWCDRVARGEAPAPPPAEVQALAEDGAVVSVPPASAGSDGRDLPGKLPYIVIVLDEFADLMMQQGKEVEVSVGRLAQKARAAGMHVVLATQRPSVDVITGMIKANFPSRIAFRVAQKVDSRTVLDEQGAEWLLGKGDMLVKLNGTDTRRVQCPFVSEEEVAALGDHLRRQGVPQYHDAILRAGDDDEHEEDDDGLDPRFDEAVRVVAETRRCSTSWLQRKLTIGYNRAAKLVEAMERRGMVGPPQGARDREVLIPPPSV